MRHRKVLERRTFNQDQFDILIKKLKMGEASFNDLTELDAIVNRDPDIREKVLNALEGHADMPDKFDNTPPCSTSPTHSSKSVVDRVVNILRRIFTASYSNLSQNFS